MKHLKRRAVLQAVRSGIEKAGELLVQAESDKEKALLSGFISQAFTEVLRFKKDRNAVDIDIDSILPDELSGTMAHNLREKADIATVQDLILSDLRVFRSALRQGRIPLQETLIAMRPNVIDTKPPRKSFAPERLKH